jgi:type IV secretion system protein TrbJ
MTSRHLRAAALAGAAFISISALISPAHAQWIVFDPTNYSQNVLTAARALEQVNKPGYRRAAPVRCRGQLHPA